MSKRYISSGALFLVLIISINVLGQESKTDKETNIKALIGELYKHPWPTPQIMVISPTIWEFGFTGPMLKILQMGPVAQNALLEKLSDQRIRDQIMILLGGIGDEQAVGPIIDAMVAADKIDTTPNAKRINLSANLTLTNITVADVIWHHGGGIIVERCPDNPKECWQTWWKENRATFTVKGITQGRRYSNYPNYGIYKQQ
jgi:hypothetical protein